MTITITLTNVKATINTPVHVTANITSDIPIKNIEWTTTSNINFSVSLDQKTLNFTPSANGAYAFICTVTDNNNNKQSATLTITVGESEPPIPPTNNCPPGQHCDPVTHLCVPDVIPPPIPPQPAGLIYNSDTDIDWAKIEALPNKILKVTDVYGTFKPNGKYFRMKASGSPRMYINAVTKELMLEHDGDYGRAYFGVCNYQSRLEVEFKLDSCSHNFSMKTRNRHQYADIVSGAPDIKRQGGMGNAYHCDSVENDLEIVHGTGGEGGSSKSLSPKLEANKWYKIKFTQTDKGTDHIHIKDELDRGDGQGFKVVAEADVPAPSQFFNKADFETWSEFWLRLNASGGGKLWMKNIKMYAL